MAYKNGDVVRLDHLQLNRNKQKDCSCHPPRYELDTVNRRVQCMSCGAIVDAFDAMLNQGLHVEEQNRLQQARYDEAKRLKQEADYYERRIEEAKNTIRNMDIRPATGQSYKG